MTGKSDLQNRTPEDGKQKLTLLDRRALELSGIEDVISFDETGAVLRTTLGMLAVDGAELHVVKLDLSGGSIYIEGKVNGLFFSEAKGGKSRSRRAKY